MTLRSLTFALLITSTCLAAHATPPAPPVQKEIDALLGRLQSSGCRFNRNGSWYDAAEARDHLLQKLQYIEGHGTLGSTEQFIELAATKSSFSGKPYQVQCGAAPAVDSAAWLTQQLKQLRAGAGPSARP
jgi:hypothetical protein